jgi:hypothetical protein
VRTIKADESSRLRYLRNSDTSKELTKRDSSPDAVAEPGSTPVKTDCLLLHILFLPPISSTYQQHRKRGRTHLNEFFHGDAFLLVYITTNADPVLVPVKMRYSAMISDKVQRSWRDGSALYKVT